MKKILLFLTVFSSLFINLTFAQISLNLTTPADVGACQLNSYIGKYPGRGAVQGLSINSSILNKGSLTCGLSNGSLVVLDSIRKQNGDTIIPLQTFIDSSNGTWSGTLPIVSNVDTVYIYYHILIDCSVIPTGSVVPSLQLVQTWTDSIGVFDINNTGNASDTSNTIKYPLLVNLSPPIYTMGYKDTIDLSFIIVNSGTTDANINVSFTPDASLYCGAIDTLGYSYKVGSLSTPVSFLPANSFFVPIPKNDTLFILQKVVSNSCLGICSPTPHAEFKWRCTLNSGYESSFCDSCYGSKDLSYFIQNASTPVLHIDRLLPVSDYEANYDTSCVNQDTSLLREWKFKIYVTGDGLLDSAFIYFHNSNPAGFNTLSLIPFSSIEIDTFFNSGGCYLDTAYFINPNALCSTAINDPLGFLNLRPHNFGKNDSIILSFKTYRCVEEDSNLFNIPKYFNSWKFEGSFSRSICLDSITPTLNPSYSKFNITNHVGANVFQNLYFAPTITDLSASNEKATPIDSLWGDSASFEIELKGYLWETMDNQLFGCYKDSLSGCIPEGYLRIAIETETGLAPSMIDSMVQLRYLDSLGSEVLISPEYYYTTIPYDSCKKGITNLYYKLSSPGVITALKTGSFDFMLKSCCGGQNGGVPYAVKFYFLLDPSGNCVNLTYPVSGHDTLPICDGGAGCEWLPLSKIEDEIVVHCPGCVTPGIVVSNYSINRSSFGLQDSDNDGRADDSLIHIEKGSTWFNQNKAKLKTAYAGLGDKLEDRLLAYFGAGDPSADGYNYPMMVIQNADLNYLQLSRKIPLGNSLMGITVDTIVIYIDTPDTTQSNPCIECVEYGLSPTQYSTQRKLIISGASINNYLNTVGDYYLFTLSSRDSAGSWIGNLHSPTFTTDSSINHPLAGFFENQRYRMRVNYSICGNFMMANNDIKTELEDVRKESEIKNTMWLSGSPKPANPFDSSFFAQPASDTLLHLAGWSFPPDTIGSEVDSLFAQQYLFICEDFGGKLYFFSHDGRNNSFVSDQANNCIKSIHVVSEARVGGNLLKVYPFEYRPATFQASEFRVIVPPNYYISSSYVTNTINLYDSLMSSERVYFSLTDTTGTVSIYDTLFPDMTCLADSSVTDTNLLYFGSSYTSRALYLELKPFNCHDNLMINETDSIVKIIFTTNRNTCININACALSLIDTVPTLPYQDINFTINPNDTITFNPIVTGLENTICFPFSLSNPSITGSTYAPNYFLYMPSTTDVPFLSGWTLINTATGIPVPMVDSVFQIDSVLGVNETARNYELCANFIACPDNYIDSLELQFGWHCDGYPAKSDTDSVCGSTSIIFEIQTDSSRVNELGKLLVTNEIIPYSLCTPFTYKKCFKSVDRGAVSPIAFLVDTPQTWLNIISFYVSRDSCPNDSIPVLLQPSSSGSYQFAIPDSALTQLGYSDSLLHFLDCLCGSITFQSECDTAGGELPNIKLIGESFCGDTLSIEVLTFYTAVWDSVSACHDCFDLKKTASQSSIQAGDTMSFNIIICANNADSGFVYIDEILPANFNLIGSIPPYIITPAQGCDTVVVTGFFNIPSACDDNYNVVKILFSNYDSLNTYTGIDSLIDSTCVTVGVACIDSNTVIFLDGDFSSDYSSTYSNETIYIEGLFTLDRDLLLVNCQVYTAAGAHIVVTRDASFDLDSTIIQGCDSMWQGITLTEDSKLRVRNFSSIKDANIGAEMLDSSQAYVQYSEIINSVTGIKVVGPTGGTFYGNLTITEATFGMFRTIFKPEYLGQPSHGAIPYAGIDANDAVLVLGDAGIPSYFYRMNKGISGLRTQMEIHNCKFNGITLDNSYHTASDGSAVASEGDFSLTPSYLQLLPADYPDTTITNCHIGVYNSYSNLILQYCIMDNVRTGVVCANNKYRQYSLVTDNTINATLYGALFMNNGGADYNILAGNFIKVDGYSSGVGIAIRESKNGVSGNYDVAWNHEIRVVDGTAGIELSNVASPQVRCNVIKLDEGDEQAISSTGISVLGCSSANITQNSVTGYTRSNTSRMGLSSQVSTSCLIGCNSVDSTGYGFHFGSSNLFTNFRGNKMKNHLEGLHLNTTAVIDTQTHAGNQWLGNYSPWFGAVNMNAASITNLQQSLFLVDPSMGGTFNPTFPINPLLAPYIDNAGWFQPDTTTTFYACPDETTCYQSEYVGDEGSPSLLAMIALDSILSVDYIEESQSIAQSLLYEKLMRDTALTGSDIIYQNFIYNEQVLHYLYEARLSLQEYGEVEDSLAAVLLSMDSTIKIFSDSIRYYLNLQMETEMNYDTIIAGFRASLNLSRNVYASVIQQMRYEDNEILAEAGFYNSLVGNADELPEINEEIMNEVEIAYEESGIEGIDSYLEEINEIAFQCPYQGGQGVFRARYFLSLFNDSIEYDDASVCLAQGILKTNHSVKNIAPLMLVKPNPASNETEVFLTGIDFERYQLKIISFDGRLVSELSLKHSPSGNKIRTSHLMPGVYYLEAAIDSKSVCRTKLIIVR